MRARRDAALRLLKTMLVASIVIPVAIFCYASWLNYRSAFDHADEELKASLNILSQHASGIFQSVELAFTAADAIIGDLTDEQIKASEQTLHAQLSKIEKSTTAIDAILIVNRNGQTVISSAVFPIRARSGWCRRQAERCRHGVVTDVSCTTSRRHRR